MTYYDFRLGLTQKQFTLTFRDEAPSKTTVYYWFSEFNRGRSTLTDEFKSCYTSRDKAKSHTNSGIVLLFRIFKTLKVGDIALRQDAAASLLKSAWVVLTLVRADRDGVRGRARPPTRRGAGGVRLADVRRGAVVAVPVAPERGAALDLFHQRRVARARVRLHT
ncbi:hypothetical protein EVAR_21281_1 [Eumeta japonica]|uniref:Mos1 transposase HTH domain-containing protein n=1 Tax=Eumeta variegata TaxID=151549 RepID=A0A4C1WMS3_EUMVA|nr:hypothetical protein EVAR_21281_1 [Eumeta japonica]